MYASESTLEVLDGDFRDNVATSEGGGIFAFTSDVDVSGSEFRRNKANKGGGLRHQGGTLKADHTTWRENSNSAISLSMVDLDAEDMKFERNSGAQGGAIDTDGLFSLTNGEFVRNSATSIGGAISLRAPHTTGTSTIKNVLFRKNNAANGGAIYLKGTNRKFSRFNVL